MNKTTYQVILSTDGKHTVIVSTDGIEETDRDFAWAAAMYERLVDHYGLKYDRNDRKPAANGEEEEIAPICAEHGKTMKRQQGKFGSFWSCHTRNPDGSWCDYKPE